MDFLANYSILLGMLFFKRLKNYQYGFGNY
jgi:hypothetical protein